MAIAYNCLTSYAANFRNHRTERRQGGRRWPCTFGRISLNHHAKGGTPTTGAGIVDQIHLQEIHFLWRPFLPDADDDMVLELAFAAGCRHIITHNVKDFHGAEQLGVTALTPRDFLKLIRT
jgi:hypothetical protein